MGHSALLSSYLTISCYKSLAISGLYLTFFTRSLTIASSMLRNPFISPPPLPQSLTPPSLAPLLPSILHLTPPVTPSLLPLHLYLHPSPHHIPPSLLCIHPSLTSTGGRCSSPAVGTEKTESEERAHGSPEESDAHQN
jgi:hypothetical protein